MKRNSARFEKNKVRPVNWFSYQSVPALRLLLLRLVKVLHYCDYPTANTTNTTAASNTVTLVVDDTPELHIVGTDQ